MPYPERFAQLYNWLIYGEAEPEASSEVLDFLHQTFTRVAGYPVQEVLDLGCGRGRLLVPLLREGYRVTGLDNSPGMLGLCRERLEREGLATELIAGAWETLEADAEFDAIIAIDSVVCYLREPREIVAALGRCRRALRPGGVLVLDNWNTLGNWRLLGAPQRFCFEGPEIQVEYVERNTLDSFASLWSIELDAVITEAGRSSPFQHVETLRVMTIPELLDYLR